MYLQASLVALSISTDPACNSLQLTGYMPKSVGDIPKSLSNVPKPLMLTLWVTTTLLK